MTIETLLTALHTYHLGIKVDNGSPKLRGPSDNITSEITAACTAHRAHLVRLYRPRAAVSTWRKAMARGSHQLRAAWCEVAAGHEAQGHYPVAAEFLAWGDVSR